MIFDYDFIFIFGEIFNNALFFAAVFNVLAVNFTIVVAFTSLTLKVLNVESFFKGVVGVRNCLTCMNNVHFSQPINVRNGEGKQRLVNKTILGYKLKDAAY